MLGRKKERGEGEGRKKIPYLWYTPFALKAVFRAILNDFEFTVPIIKLGTVNGELSKSLKKPLLRQKDDYIPQIRKFNIYL